MSAMRILACFMVTPDYEALRESEWSATAARGASSGGGVGAAVSYTHLTLPTILRV